MGRVWVAAVLTALVLLLPARAFSGFVYASNGDGASPVGPLCDSQFSDVLSHMPPWSSFGITPYPFANSCWSGNAYPLANSSTGMALGNQASDYFFRNILKVNPCAVAAAALAARGGGAEATPLELEPAGEVPSTALEPVGGGSLKPVKPLWDYCPTISADQIDQFSNTYVAQHFSHNAGDVLKVTFAPIHAWAFNVTSIIDYTVFADVHITVDGQSHTLYSYGTSGTYDIPLTNNSANDLLTIRGQGVAITNVVVVPAALTTPTPSAGSSVYCGIVRDCQLSELGSPNSNPVVTTADWNCDSTTTQLCSAQSYLRTSPDGFIALNGAQQAAYRQQLGVLPKGATLTYGISVGSWQETDGHVDLAPNGLYGQVSIELDGSDGSGVVNHVLQCVQQPTVDTVCRDSFPITQTVSAVVLHFLGFDSGQFTPGSSNRVGYYAYHPYASLGAVPPTPGPTDTPVDQSSLATTVANDVATYVARSTSVALGTALPYPQNITYNCEVYGACDAVVTPASGTSVPPVASPSASAVPLGPYPPGPSSSSCAAVTWPIVTAPPDSLFPSGLQSTLLVGGVVEAAAVVVGGAWSLLTQLIFPQHASCDFSPMINTVQARVHLPPLSSYAGVLDLPAPSCGYFGVRGVYLVGKVFDVGFNDCGAPWSALSSQSRSLTMLLIWSGAVVAAVRMIDKRFRGHSDVV